MRNTFVKVLSFVMALMMVVGTFGTLAVFAADEHTHTKGTLIETVNPTCENFGYSRYICGDAACGKEWVTDVVYASDDYHNYISYNAVAASCLSNAITAGKKCEYCGDVLEGCVESEGTQLLHKFVRAEVAPTCTEDGKYVATCKLCKKTAEELYEDNKFTADQDYWDWAEEPTGKVALDPEHENLAWVIVTAPANVAGACTDGLATGVCENCGKVVNAVIPVEHDYSVNLNPTGATCTEYKSGSACKYCGKVADGAVKNDADKVGKHENVGNVKGKFDVNAMPYKASGDQYTLAELYAMGFAIGEDLYKDSTCKETGYQIVECKCGAISRETIAVKAHSFGDYGAIVWPTNCTEAAVKVRTCVYGCETKETLTIAAATATTHAAKVEVIAPTCVAMGYTKTTCTNTYVVDGVVMNCAHEVKDSYVDPTGHTWGAVTYVSGDCGSATYKQTCTAEGCGVTKDAAEPDDKKNHTWGAEVTVAGTCQDVAHKTKTCSVCNKVERISIDGAEKDASNHVYPTGDALLTVDGTIVIGYVSDKAPTCTTTATAIVTCKYGCENSLTTKTTGTAAHKLTANYYVVEDGNKVAKEGELKATCQATGYENDGKVCSVCCYVEKAATVVAIDATNHAGTKTAVGSVVSATCQHAAYQLYNTTCCGLVTVYDGDKVGHSYETVAFKAPTCTAAGNHEYQKCKWCDDKKAYSTSANGCTLGCTNHDQLVATDVHGIAALNHDYKKVDARPAADCESTGFAEYYDCARCDMVKLGSVEYNTANADENTKFIANGTVAAHYNAYKVTLTAVDATCTTKGVMAGTYCRICDKDEWLTDTIPHDKQTKLININNRGEIIDCTKAICLVETCKDCTWSHTEYAEAKNTAHKYPETWTEVLPEGPTCKFDTLEVRDCPDCICEEGTQSRVKTAATGCYTTKGVVGGTKYAIDYNCNKIAEFIDMRCDACLDVVDWTDIAHNVVVDEADATCTADGHYIEYCSTCNYTDDVTTYDYAKTLELKPNLGGHVYGTIIERVEPADGVDGFVTFICPVCGETVTEVLDASIYFNTTIETDATVVAAGDEIVVTVYVSASALSFNQLYFYIDTYAYGQPLKRLGDAFKVVDAEIIADLGANLHIDASNEIGEFCIYTENDAEGNVVDVVLDGEDIALATLTLVANSVNGETEIEVGAYGFVNTETEDYMDYLDDEGSVINVKVAIPGNLNGDSMIGISDIQALIPMVVKMAAAGEYSVMADVNKDGVVDQFDVADLRVFVKNGCTALAYIEMAYADEFAAAVAALNITDLADEIGFGLFLDIELAEMPYETFLGGLDLYGSVEDVVEVLYYGYANGYMGQ